MATTVIKPVKIKLTVFSNLTDPTGIKEYMDSCNLTGSTAVLYKNPKITTAFYTQGADASAAIQEAKNTYTASPTDGNLGLWMEAGQNGIVWLLQYADKVEIIANDDANRTTREEAKTNLELSYLTPQKLARQSKGRPATPVFTAENVGTGKVDTTITNGVDYNPNSITYIIFESSVAAAIRVTVEDGLEISVEVRGSVKIKTTQGKGTYMHFTGLKPGVDYTIYAFAQNSKKLISALSLPVTAKG